MKQRPRRLRKSESIRDLIHEVEIRPANLVQPYFLATKPAAEEPITGFTGISRLGVDKLSARVEVDLDRGLKSVLLFSKVPDEKKDETGSALYGDDSLLAEGIRKLKARFADAITLFSDVCLCPGTTHGHCGILENGKIQNDKSLEALVKMAGVHAEAGVDFVAPSDMMDGRVGRIREYLDQRGYTDTGILAYTAKYHSSYYGPFREALGSAPKGPDRGSYQMDYRNKKEAMRELALDLKEGADIVMVKPALAYLDIIAAFKSVSPVPVAAYSVSGEYEAAKALAKAGLADEKKLVLENLTAIRRAGADIIITYHASDALQKGWIR